jgi:hypothetical protein
VHPGPGPYSFGVLDDDRSVEITVSHPDYVPQSIKVELKSGAIDLWDDPPTQQSTVSGSVQLTMPLARIRHAPGQIPPWGNPRGDERGVYIHQEASGPQEYDGQTVLMGPQPRVWELDDLAGFGAGGGTTCLLDPHDDDGWKRFNEAEARNVRVEGANNGGFVWLEYGSLSPFRPREPRFLIGLWAPPPNDVFKDGAVDVLVFFSPSTATQPYQVSTFPFKDKYPYSAILAKAVDPTTGRAVDAKLQPYVHLGAKYLFADGFLAHESVASGKPLLIVMPIFPNVDPRQARDHMWQPFRSKAGLYRLLLEIVQFLHREGYKPGFAFDSRWNGGYAPIAGAPPTRGIPRRAPANRPVPGIRNVVVAAYSSGVSGVFPIFKTDAIAGSTADYPPALFGADPAEFDKRWREFWDLDLFLDPVATGIPRADYESTLSAWLGRENRRLRLYHGGWTIGQTDPDQFFPKLRRLLSGQPTVRKDLAVPARWSVDWWDPTGQWRALFWSAACLRAKYVTAGIVPDFPLGDATKGSPPSAVHLFAMQLGFGHASRLRQT